MAPSAPPVGGHDAEETLMLGDRQDQPHRLLDFARGKFAQRIRHRRNQLFHPQKRADFFLIEKHELVVRLEIDQFAEFL